MFEQNIAELSKKNPVLAEKIKAHGPAKNIEVFESESKNFIISYKGVLLHSNEDPLRESKSIWYKTVQNDLKPNDIQIIYGLGLGYLFKRAYVSANSRILVYEPIIDILRFVFENVAIASEIADDRVHFVDNEDDAIKFFENKYLPGDRVEVLFLPSYLSVPGCNLISFTSDIYNVLKDRSIDHNTVLLHAKDTVRNFISRVNLMSDFYSVNALEGQAAGKTALIVTAGPSLNKDIALIKKNRDKFIVIAILPIIPTLIDNGIKPDFVTVVDASNQLFKVENYLDKLSDLNLVIESRTDAALNELKTKSKFVYFPLVDKLSEYIMGQMPGSYIQQLPATPSVSILAYELAKLLGCKKIVFSGLDLALTGGKIYAHDYITLSGEEGENLVMECSKGKYYAKTTTVKSANGSEIKTREDYLFFIREFAKLAEQSPDIQLINTALDGAYVEGMTYAPMTEVVADINEPAKFDVDLILVKSDDYKLADFDQATKKVFENTINELEAFRPKLNSAVLALTGLKNELNAPTPDLEKFQKLFNKNVELMSVARNFLTQHFLLSTYLQAEIAQFITGYIKGNQVSIETIKTNLEVELTLLKATLDAMSDLLPQMKAVV